MDGKVASRGDVSTPLAFNEKSPLHFANPKNHRKRSVFEGVVPRDDMHEAFRMASGAQKRRNGRCTHVLESPSVRGAKRCVCAPKRRTQPR